MTLPGDDLIGEPSVQTTDALWIDAAPGAVWSALAGMHGDQDGVFTHPRPRKLFGRQVVSVGDTVRLTRRGWMGLPDGITLRVVDVIEEKSILLRAQPVWHDSDAVWSVHLIPRWDDRCRLLIRHRVRLHHPGEVLAVELAAPIAAALTRAAAIAVRNRVREQDAAPRTG